MKESSAKIHNWKSLNTLTYILFYKSSFLSCRGKVRKQGFLFVERLLRCAKDIRHTHLQNSESNFPVCKKLLGWKYQRKGFKLLYRQNFVSEQKSADYRFCQTPHPGQTWALSLLMW